MINQAHFSYPFLIALLFGIAFGHLLSIQEAFVLLFFSFAPDIDFLAEMYLNRKNPTKIVNHHKFITHAPLFYVLFLAILSIWSVKFALLSSYGLLTHFVMDTIVAPHGIRWLYPFKKKFYRWGDFTKGIDDTNKWLMAYKRLPIYKYDNIAFFITVILVIALYIV